MRIPPAAAAVLATALAVAGCSSLLPRSESEVQATWASFEDAKAAIDAIEPHRTTRADLHAKGLDPYANPNVELLNYSDVLRRFPVPGTVARLDAGLRECLEAGKACTGYSIEMHHTHTERTGPFLLDVLSFRRETKSVGWAFSALVLMVDDQVVYALYGGKPAIEEMEKRVEPLGPLQNWDAAQVLK